MPRMQVYLPDDLYDAIKSRGLAASELLQEAVRGELRRRELLEETDRYVQELVAKVGLPTPTAMAQAESLSTRIRRHHTATRAS